MLDWKTEEKVLLEIKKLIAVVWRMHPEQLSRYHQKLQKTADTALPGKIGRAFLDILEQMSVYPSDAKSEVRTELLQDADRLLDLIHRHGKLDETAWRSALQKLESQPDKVFRTELGRAFILALKEKPGIGLPSGQTCVTGQKELEKIADWLMQDNPDALTHTAGLQTHQSRLTHAERIKIRQKPKTDKKRTRLSAGILQKASITVFACLSFCFMSIWLHGQVERNQNKWHLQQMKTAAAKEADVFPAGHPPAQADAAVRTEHQTQQQTDSLTKGSHEITKQTIKNTSQKSSGTRIQTQSPNDDSKTPPEILPQYKEMSAQYPELFGWLQIPGTQIDFPVMRSSSDDPEFYLHHDFTGAESSEGALFVDPLNSSCPQDANIVIYGHNMKNGHIFGTLNMYGVPDFFQEHQEIHFDTIYETGIYEAVAVLKTRIRDENEQGFRYYQFFRYENETEFQECADFVENNQLFETSDTLRYGDQILMLSTCEYSQENGRLVVVARKVSSE